MKEVICEYCNEKYKVYPSKLERTRFCSRECKGKWESENKTEKNNPNWSGGKVEIECENCGKKFKVNKYEKRNGRKFCSLECRGEKQSERMKGKNNPSWKEKEKLRCEWCGKIFKIKPSLSQERRFCSDECYKKWLSENRKGCAWLDEKNPSWKGGVTDDRRFYGCNWEEQREKRLKKDRYKCQLCDSKKDLVVHHKRPLRTFDKTKEDWYKKANDIENLITLCRSCHSKQHHNEKESIYILIGVDK